MKRFHSLFMIGISLFSVAAYSAELRVLTHYAFSLSKQQLAEFEHQSGVSLTLIRAGDAGEMVNKLVLTKAHPIADVAFGIDNALVGRALAAGIIDPYVPRLPQHVKATLPGGVVSIDYSYVTLNYDKAWFMKHRLPLPRTLDDLTLPRYKNLLVVENPATSSPGLGFLLSTIHTLGEENAFRFWQKLRANGVKVVNGWSEAYYTEFSHHGGSRPLVLSYATSPLAEKFHNTVHRDTSPTGNLLLPGAVFRQIEGIALIRGGKQRKAAEQFIEFMRSRTAQYALQTTMWVYPVVRSVTLTPLFRSINEPSMHQTPDETLIHANHSRWLTRWTRTVLR